MTMPHVGGYNWREELSLATLANREATDTIARIEEDRPGPGQTAILLLRIATILTRQQRHLTELEQIGSRSQRKGRMTPEQERRSLAALLRAREV